MTTERKTEKVSDMLRPLQFSYSQRFGNYQIHTADMAPGRNDWVAITKCETLSSADHRAYAACLAAGPELLAALKGLMLASARLRSEYNDMDKAAKAADAAILKATHPAKEG